jgi:hypothetical protein
VVINNRPLVDAGGLTREVVRRFGPDPRLTYHRVKALLMDGRIPAAKNGARWEVDPACAELVPALLGLAPTRSA